MGYRGGAVGKGYSSPSSRSSSSSFNIEKPTGRRSNVLGVLFERGVTLFFLESEDISEFRLRVVTDARASSDRRASGRLLTPRIPLCILDSRNEVGFLEPLFERRRPR